MASDLFDFNDLTENELRSTRHLNHQEAILLVSNVYMLMNSSMKGSLQAVRVHCTAEVEPGEAGSDQTERSGLIYPKLAMANRRASSPAD